MTQSDSLSTSPFFLSLCGRIVSCRRIDPVIDSAESRAPATCHSSAPAALLFNCGLRRCFFFFFLVAFEKPHWFLYQPSSWLFLRFKSKSPVSRFARNVQVWNLSALYAGFFQVQPVHVKSWSRSRRQSAGFGAVREVGRPRPAAEDVFLIRFVKAPV